MKTSRKLAEGLKLNYGEAYPPLASKETFQVEVIGEVEAVEVTEAYLSEIISARIKHILEQIKQELDRRRPLDLPGGIVLIGGNAILQVWLSLLRKSWRPCQALCSKSSWYP